MASARSCLAKAAVVIATVAVAPSVAVPTITVAIAAATIAIATAAVAAASTGGLDCAHLQQGSACELHCGCATPCSPKIASQWITHLSF